MRSSAEAGQHNFIGRTATVLANAGFTITYHDIAEADRHPEGTYSLTHMKPPTDARGLLFRRVYHYPFWQIERQAERWLWDVAARSFRPEEIDAREAHQFYDYWRKRLFGGTARSARREGCVYVPLQGRLLTRRSFQSCSPLEMLEHCLRHEKTRKIIATLHPKEHYSHAELAALTELEHRFPRLSIRTGEMEALLQDCDYVVTQNSAAGFAGYLFGKPLLLFGEIDFHHIAIKADHGNLQDSFVCVIGHRPDYARYLWWFWQDQSINAGRPEAETKIVARLRRYGWPV
ncbi:hypothetical protein ACFSUD_16935 [Sulfitobacter aestuarii]|uniref:Capsule polysaccharide biosynthesis protein n=1 Tax=Sulfitobacter aestuarii TaxID=2161676 RepID=A0ABW5U7S8_9RHOB